MSALAGNSIHDEQKTVAEVVPVSGDQPNGPALAVRQDAEAIVLDFMNPSYALLMKALWPTARSPTSNSSQ